MSIDTLRTAICNFLVARQRNEPFLVRIADTQKADVIEGKDTEIMQILEKFALTHDQVYHQSEHLHLHQTLAIRLLEEQKAFICTCTPEEIEAERKAAEEAGIAYRYSGHCENLENETLAALKESGTPFVIRLKKPAQPVVWDDLIRGRMESAADEVDSIVILNADNTPTPDFATACDDMLSNVTLVIHDDKAAEQTPRLIHIKQMLGYKEETHYAHLPALHSNDTQDVLLKDLLAEGIIPDAIINYLILLDNPDAPSEIFTLPEAIAWFVLERVGTTPITFNLDTLCRINREHLKRMDDKRLSTLFGFADADIGKLAKVYLNEVSTVTALTERILAIFAPKTFEGEHETLMRQIQHLLIDAPMFESFDALETYLVQETGMAKETLSLPLRLLLTGAPQGPDLNDIYPYIRCYLLEVIS
jgi:glutamyl-tRNA synthetase